MSREEVVEALCRPVVEGMGFEWVGVEYHHNSQNAILRIYVDRPEGGIAMDDVVAVTEQINPLLDVEDPISGMYTLEVSSPGLDRPLFTLAHYEKFIGREAKVTLKRALDRRRRFEGEIVKVEDGNVILNIRDGKEWREVAVEFANIDKARLVPVFD
ncbi:MAG: ribosome maturation factor RimP [Cardiobacteriaceae bacterium]|nr:ribosome maturation factor RimP [Cardiobacteriaceae bacterium]